MVLCNLYLTFHSIYFLNMTNIYMLQIGLFMFFKNELLPVGFHDMSLSSSQLHSYNTRNAMNYRSQFLELILGNLPWHIKAQSFGMSSLLNSKTNLQKMSLKRTYIEFYFNKLICPNYFHIVDQ